MNLKGQMRVQDTYVGEKADKYGATLRCTDRKEGGVVVLSVPVEMVKRLKIDDLLDVDCAVKFTPSSIGLQVKYVEGKIEVAKVS